MSAIQVGATFGTLTVRSKAESRSGHAYWNVGCKCGATHTVRATDLRKNRPKCGCTAREGLPAAPSAKDMQALLDWLPKAVAAMDSLMKLLTSGGAPTYTGKPAQASQPSTSLKDYNLTADPSTVTAAVAEARAKAVDKTKITKATILAGCSTRQQVLDAYKTNHERALAILAIPFKDRTPELKEELRQRWIISNDRIGTELIPSDPGFADYSNECYKMKRALDDWERDPATL